MASDAAEDLEERAMAATLEGRCAPPLGGAAIAPSEPAPAAAERAGWKSRPVAAARRYGYPIALVSVAILYVVWPRNLAPDGKWYGGADDVVFLILLAFLARRVAKRTPALLDLPGAISRAVRRKLRFNR